MRHAFAVSLLAAAVIGGCKSGGPDTVVPGQELMVKGEIVSGAESPMIVAAGDRRFSLAGDLGRFKVGDRVCVRGKIAGTSRFMAGEPEGTISITAIGPENECP